jgi:c-di-GMP-binding flagellar brake protein YcgR
VKEGRQPSSRRSVELPPAPPSQPESEAKPDNRRFDRASYLTPVRILRDGGENVDGQCEDLSEGGMLVIAADVLADGERVNIRFALPVSGKIVTTQAIARWLRGAREGRGAMGLEFVELTPEVRRGIVGYVRHFRGARRGDG